MKKILLFVLVAAVALAGCGRPGGNEPAYDYDSEREQNDISHILVYVTIEEQVIMEQNDIRVTALAFEQNAFQMPALRVLIENSSDIPLVWQALNASVNGIMIRTDFASAVAPGGSTKDEISFLPIYLEEAGIETISEIGLRFSFAEDHSFAFLFESDIITIPTSAAGYTQPLDDSGSVILDQDGFRVVIQELYETFSGDAAVRILIQNNSDNDILIHFSDLSVNGWLVKHMFSGHVFAGASAFNWLLIPEYSLEDIDVDADEIEEMDFVIHISNIRSHDSLVSEWVSVTF